MPRGRKTNRPSIKGRGPCQLRWRESHTQANGTVARRQRKLTVETLTEAVALADRIEADLERYGFFRSHDTAVARPHIPRLSELSAQRMLSKAVKKPSPNSIRAQEGEYRRFLRSMAATLDVSVAALQAEHLNETNFGAAVVHMQTERKLADSTVYNAADRAFDLWRWIEHRHPGVTGKLPFEPSAVLPSPPEFAPPGTPARWPDVDSCLNRIRIGRALRAAALMRFTGLRLSQVAAIEAQDLNLENRTLVVRKGKSRRETAQKRKIPISGHLVEACGPWLAESAGPLFPQSRGSTEPMKSPRNLTRYVTEAWKLASEDGAVHSEVWRPGNRGRAQPDHAFRVCFQHELMASGVGESVLDFLVGHASSSTRGRHYTDPAWNLLEAAIAKVPPVEWTDEALETLRTDVNRGKKK